MALSGTGTDRARASAVRSGSHRVCRAQGLKQPVRPGQRGGYPAVVGLRRLKPGTRGDNSVRRGHRPIAGITPAPLVDLPAVGGVPEQPPRAARGVSTQNTAHRLPDVPGQHPEPLRFLIVGAGAVGGVLRIATQLEDDGTIGVLTPQFDVELGELDGSPSTRVDRLASAFKDAGADVTVPGNILGAMWAKWVFIASLGAVTSLMRAAVGDIVAVPGGQRFAQSVLSEAAAAAAAYGHPGQLHATERALTAPGSPATSSLTRDLVAGRRTEVEAVLADVAARARAAGTGTALIDLAVLALRIRNRQVAVPGS